jgi:iron(III) transport system ATP-binding protein
MTKAVILQLENIVKQFSRTNNTAVDGVSLTLEQGDILGLLGPSGCGKTTLLRIIAGFESSSQGKVTLAEQIVCGQGCWLPPEKRNTGMVFQDYALFPHLNVAENIAFGLKSQKSSLDRQQIKQRVAEVLALVGLTGLEKRYPHELSGGQQQRIALARALAPQPALILLDEPLSNLDVQVRLRLREEIRSIIKAAGTSAIFVTHDREEALAICDRIAVMRQGKLEQIGTPEEIYIQPASRFVAEFVTQANFLPAKRNGEFWTTEIGKLAIPNQQSTHSYDLGELMLPQEDIILTPDENADVVVKDRQFLGREYRYCLETASGKRLHARTTAYKAVAIGTKVNLSVMGKTSQVFPK